MTIKFDKYGLENHHAYANENLDLSLFYDFSLINEIDDIQNVQFSDAESLKCFNSLKPRGMDYTSGAICNYAEAVGLLIDSGGIHPAGAREKHCYADS